jgi:hypothetical protein
MIKRLDSKLWGINIGISIFFILSVLFLYPEIDTDEDGLASFGFSLLSLTFLLRELDVEKFDLPSFIIMLGSGAGRNLLLGSLWIILLVFIFKYKSVDKNKIVSFLFSMPGQMLMFSALMLVLGAMMDKNVFSLQHLTTRFYEELLELLGYFYLFSASVLRIKQ